MFPNEPLCIAFSSSIPNSAIGINALSLIPGAASVPEPTTTAALVIMAGVMVGYRRRLV
ncbi:PEP-CTERM sorting domain-containing protein [Leptolyngbya cf. ectocarpi LEGE 11479]|uniref:PEP-CTERM sorting domain-containing protein n=1 Tax=Leptolyngbya cf. ectocarpi LEGE 11479 TaxID=1828722 RepID=A0A928X355_LEPEC|nr:PEP-CTERM sorting domain-containing protein [Leptolyngbya cf. ectocarpi LEGE 11479]